MTKVWFKARTYGWGLTPASIEGWIVVGIFLALIFAGIAVFLHEIHAGVDAQLALILFALWVALLIGIFIWIALATGERPRWRWGA
jgi:uncharacterized membrane protein